MVAIQVKVGHGQLAISHTDKDIFPNLKLIAGVGIAAGFRENGVKLGDVLVSTQIHDCALYKKKGDKDSLHDTIRESPSLMFEHFKEPFHWTYLCTQDKQYFCKIKSSLILTKPALMDDKEAAKQLLKHFGEEAKG